MFLGKCFFWQMSFRQLLFSSQILTGILCHLIISLYNLYWFKLLGSLWIFSFCSSAFKIFSHFPAFCTLHRSFSRDVSLTAVIFPFLFALFLKINVLFRQLLLWYNLIFDKCYVISLYIYVGLLLSIHSAFVEYSFFPPAFKFSSFFIFCTFHRSFSRCVSLRAPLLPSFIHSKIGFSRGLLNASGSHFHVRDDVHDVRVYSLGLSLQKSYPFTPSHQVCYNYA